MAPFQNVTEIRALISSFLPVFAPNFRKSHIPFPLYSPDQKQENESIRRVSKPEKTQVQPVHRKPETDVLPTKIG